MGPWQASHWTDLKRRRELVSGSPRPPGSPKPVVWQGRHSASPVACRATRDCQADWLWALKLQRANSSRWQVVQAAAVA